MVLGPLTTQIVGSYRKPHWLARHQHMRALDGSWWRPEADVLAEAKEDAVRLAVYEQERAGLDLLTDGEAQRPAYDRHFLGCLSGLDIAAASYGVPEWSLDASVPKSSGLEEFHRHTNIMPKVVGDVRWTSPATVSELAFLRQMTGKPIKVNVVGPITLSGSLIDEFYCDKEALVLALAQALNQELKSLELAGADVLQIDEPGFHFDTDLTHRIGRKAIDLMVDGLTKPTIVHVCYGYAFLYEGKSPSASYPGILELLSDCPITGISVEYEQPGHGPELLRHCGGKHVVLGLLNLGTKVVEEPAHVAERLRGAMKVVPPERLHPSSDCGMWYLQHAVAYGKINALAAGTRMIRRELDL